MQVIQTHSGSLGGGSGLVVAGLRSLNLAGAANTRGSDVVGVDVNGKVLKGVTVDGAPGRIGLGELDGLGVVLGEVVDDGLADLGDVQHAVHQVGGPESVELGLSNGVAKAADGGERAADLEGEGADDGLRGGVVASPVTSPGCEVVSMDFGCWLEK